MNKKAFIELIRTHQKLIYKVCTAYCAEPQNRQDLEQEILLQLWKSFKKFDGRVKVTTWMYRIALNTAISFYRKGQKKAKQEVAIEQHIFQLASSDSFHEENEQIKLLYRFIAGFNELDKALVLLYLEDRKYAEIAQVLGLSETNVATKISRIKKKLKKQFAQAEKV